MNSIPSHCSSSLHVLLALYSETCKERFSPPPGLRAPSPCPVTLSRPDLHSTFQKCYGTSGLLPLHLLSLLSPATTLIPLGLFKVQLDFQAETQLGSSAK